jgi:uncharacterized protein YbaP (TraB family)
MNRTRPFLRKLVGMKRLLLIPALFFLIFCTSEAQKSLLWKVEGKGIQTSYLYGTFHIFPQEQFSIPDKVKSTFEQCDRLVMELSMAEGMEMQMLQLASMKDGMRLEDLLVPDDLIKLDSAIMANGMSMAFFNTWKPFLITSLFYNHYMKSGVASFELALQKMAIEREMEILGLETVARQMEVFDAIPYADQAEDLMDMARNGDKYQKLFDEMVVTYLSEDIEAMLEMTHQEMNNLSEIEQLLTKRNEEWIPKMKEMMKDKATFFGVGAGHLGGAEGVIALLIKEGYRVKPVLK